MFLKVLLRRLLTFLPTILGIATFAFLLGHATPGDPAYAALGIDLEGYSGVDLEEVERVRKELGLDKPILVQYVNWIWNAFQGDFGRSYVNDYVVMDAVIEALPNTLYLLGCTMIVAIIVGVSIGMISAIYQGSVGDLIARMISIIGVSTPVFWFARILCSSDGWPTFVDPRFANVVPSSSAPSCCDCRRWALLFARELARLDTVDAGCKRRCRV